MTAPSVCLILYTHVRPKFDKILGKWPDSSEWLSSTMSGWVRRQDAQIDAATSAMRTRLSAPITATTLTPCRWPFRQIRSPRDRGWRRRPEHRCRKPLPDRQVFDPGSAASTVRCHRRKDRDPKLAARKSKVEPVESKPLSHSQCAPAAGAQHGLSSKCRVTGAPGRPAAGPRTGRYPGDPPEG